MEYLYSIFGPSVLLEFVRNVLSVIVSIYLTVLHLRIPDERTGLYESLVTCWIIFFKCREVAIIVSCHMTKSEAHKFHDNVYRALWRQHVSTDALEQLKILSVQLTVNGIKFTAFGYWTLPTVIASVVKYIVVLAQLNWWILESVRNSEFTFVVCDRNNKIFILKFFLHLCTFVTQL